jgi:hypothetical protein
MTPNLEGGNGAMRGVIVGWFTAVPNRFGPLRCRIRKHCASWRSVYIVHTRDTRRRRFLRSRNVGSGIALLLGGT